MTGWNLPPGVNVRDIPGCGDELEIITRYDPKPIPMRQFDWTAVRENYDLGMPMGFGLTEQDAINDLLMQEDEDD